MPLMLIAIACGAMACKSGDNKVSSERSEPAPVVPSASKHPTLATEAPFITGPALSYMSARLPVRQAAIWRPNDGVGCVVANLAPGGKRETACLVDTSLSISGGDLKTPAVHTVARPGTMLAGDVLDRPNRKREPLDELLIVSADDGFELLAYDWRGRRMTTAFADAGPLTGDCIPPTLDNTWEAVVLPGRHGGLLVAIGEPSQVWQARRAGWCVRTTAAIAAPNYRTSDGGDGRFSLDLDGDGKPDELAVADGAIIWTLSASGARGKTQLPKGKRGRKTGPSTGSPTGQTTVEIVAGEIENWLPNGRVASAVKSTRTGPGIQIVDEVYLAVAGQALTQLMAVQTTYSGSGDDISATRRRLIPQTLTGSPLLLKSTVALTGERGRASSQWFLVGDIRRDIARTYRSRSADVDILRDRLGALPTLQPVRDDERRDTSVYVGEEVDFTAKPMIPEHTGWLADDHSALTARLKLPRAGIKLGKGRIEPGPDGHPWLAVEAAGASHVILPATAPAKSPKCLDGDVTPTDGAMWLVSEKPAIVLQLAADARLWARDGASGCLLQWTVFWPSGPAGSNVDLTDAEIFLPGRDGASTSIDGFKGDIDPAAGLEVIAVDPATYDRMVLVGSDGTALGAPSAAQSIDMLFDSQITGAIRSADKVVTIAIRSVDSAHDTEVIDGEMYGTISEEYRAFLMRWDPTRKALTLVQRLDSYEGDLGPGASVDGTLTLPDGHLRWTWLAEEDQGVERGFHWVRHLQSGQKIVLSSSRP